MPASLKNLISIFGLVLLAAFGYWLFVINGNSSLSPGSDLSNSADIETRQFLVRLNELRNISIDTEILTDQRLQNLVDANVPPATYPVGRDNPFAPPN